MQIFPHHHLRLRILPLNPAHIIRSYVRFMYICHVSLKKPRQGKVPDTLPAAPEIVLNLTGFGNLLGLNTVQLYLRDLVSKLLIFLTFFQRTSVEKPPPLRSYYPSPHLYLYFDLGLSNVG